MENHTGEEITCHRIPVSVTRREGNWVWGSCGKMYKFVAKVYDTGSAHGIDGGRVSKLSICRIDKLACYTRETTTASYDRDWDIEPETEEDFVVCLAVLSCMEHLPPSFPEA